MPIGGRALLPAFQTRMWLRRCQVESGQEEQGATVSVYGAGSAERRELADFRIPPRACASGSEPQVSPELIEEGFHRLGEWLSAGILSRVLWLRLCCKRKSRCRGHKRPRELHKEWGAQSTGLQPPPSAPRSPIPYHPQKWVPLHGLQASRRLVRVAQLGAVSSRSKSRRQGLLARGDSGARTLVAPAPHDTTLSTPFCWSQPHFPRSYGRGKSR